MAASLQGPRSLRSGAIPHPQKSRARAAVIGGRWASVGGVGGALDKLGIARDRAAAREGQRISMPAETDLPGGHREHDSRSRGGDARACREDGQNA